jgi:hypothetical protein
MLTNFDFHLFTHYMYIPLDEHNVILRDKQYNLVMSDFRKVLT